MHNDLRHHQHKLGQLFNHKKKAEKQNKSYKHMCSRQKTISAKLPKPSRTIYFYLNPEKFMVSSFPRQNADYYDYLLSLFVCGRLVT